MFLHMLPPLTEVSCATYALIPANQHNPMVFPIPALLYWILKKIRIFARNKRSLLRNRSAGSCFYPITRQPTTVQFTRMYVLTQQALGYDLAISPAYQARPGHILKDLPALRYTAIGTWGSPRTYEPCCEVPF
ncbi:uncharacterized protein ARMOST_00290 [Armillaria ostoyae]|uniref:Uncharacterized protein n=1 Tax=Armillaria ostoyae TaxID=47428 RepID=A0A284QKS2_ARMOS|nr:uncharacterized protein ARMOST_00290 [Armillaria ostoyae]